MECITKRKHGEPFTKPMAHTGKRRQTCTCPVIRRRQSPDSNPGWCLDEEPHVCRDVLWGFHSISRLFCTCVSVDVFSLSPCSDMWRMALGSTLLAPLWKCHPRRLFLSPVLTGEFWNSILAFCPFYLILMQGFWEIRNTCIYACLHSCTRELATCGWLCQNNRFPLGLLCHPPSYPGGKGLDEENCFEKLGGIFITRFSQLFNWSL